MPTLNHTQQGRRHWGQQGLGDLMTRKQWRGTSGQKPRRKDICSSDERWSISYQTQVGRAQPNGAGRRLEGQGDTLKIFLTLT